MGSSNRCTLKTITVLHIAFFLSYLPADSANAIPTAEDINSLAEKARQTTDTFMQKSFNLRMAHEYSGKFLIQRDRENLHTLARSAGNQLQAIAESQRKIKQQIENYQGDDWDDRYGSTGLWRKLSTDIYATILSKCEIDFYLAISSEQISKTAQDILTQIDSLEQLYDTAYAKFLKAKTLGLLAQTDPANKPLAKEQFDLLMERSDVRHSTVFRIQIEKIKLLGESEPGRLKTIAENIATSSCADDAELVLSLAFLQRRLNRTKAFEGTVQLFPYIKDFLGSLILSQLSYSIGHQQHLQQTTVLEAELAAQAVWKDQTQDHKQLLEYLANSKKFQTPLVLYVSAVAFADSAPVKAINLLIKASRLQQLQKSNKLDVEAYQIAEQAAQLAYNLFLQNSNHCPVALQAFANYSTMAGDKIDEELEYLYSIVLNNCGQAEKAEKLLQKIAAGPAGKWRNTARLEIIERTIHQRQYENQKQRNELLKQLSNLIADLSLLNENSCQIRARTTALYCQLLLESKEDISAQKVLDMLTDAEIARDPNLSVFKSKALRQLGKLNESAHCLLAVIDPNGCEHAIEATELLSQVIDKIEQLQANEPNFIDFVQDCKKLARFCYDCLDGQWHRKAGLYLAELAVFDAATDQAKLLAVDKLLSKLAQNGKDADVDLLRCRARLFAEQGKFDEAARLWAQICKIRKSESAPPNQRSWKWWRAKFYELYCWSKWPRTKKKEILHTIEVLEKSFTDIPPLWAEKLNSLKQQCRSQLIRTGK